MRTWIFLFLGLNAFSVPSLGQTNGGNLNVCLSLADKAYKTFDKATPFLSGDGSFAVNYEGKIQVYTKSGSTIISDLSCDHDRNKKIDAGIAMIISDLGQAAHYSRVTLGKGLTPLSESQRKAFAAAINECGFIGDKSGEAALPLSREYDLGLFGERVSRPAGLKQ
jgi:hypothetical protein